MTTSRLTSITAVSAIIAGLMFMAIQPLHPSDTLASVTTSAWAIIHYATLAMLALFVAGITGIYAAQVEKLGWLGFAGYVALVVGLVLTALRQASCPRRRRVRNRRNSLVAGIAVGCEPAQARRSC